MHELHFDTIIVGSGFGGSVMAYRLAEAGLRVCLLERGKAYPPGSFPRSPYRMRDNFWDPSDHLYGLFQFWSFRHLSALVASGLGGGSLIYANVLMRKDERWFVQEDLANGGYEYWPVTRADLDPHYDRVEHMLRPQRYPFAHAPYNTTSKTIAFMAAAGRLGLKPFLPELAITFANDGEPPVTGEPIREAHANLHGRTRSTCRLCGECDVGCNYGSKNTLDYTYLSAAARCGAELRTGCEVVSFAPRRSGGYRVRYRIHAPARADGEQHATDRQLHTLTADRLVLSAGALGSTYLLLKNRSAFPHLSRRLGTRFCSNGDLLTFAVKRTADSAANGMPEVIDPGYGPVITAAALVDKSSDGEAERGMYLEDAGFPEHVAWMLGLFDMPRPLLRVIGQRFLWYWFGRGPDTKLDRELSQLLRATVASAGILPILSMGRDIPNGSMFLRDGKLDIAWKKSLSNPYYHRARDMARRLAAQLSSELWENPIWHLGRVITVHPLGGCPMGRSAAEGVVDAYGEVFNYPGLYVVDGSIMPGPVGTNPSLTIAAIADRCADRLIERHQSAAR